MTESELDCTCLNPDRTADVPRCETLADGQRACTGLGGRCEDVPCCDGTTCVREADQVRRCGEAALAPASATAGKGGESGAAGGAGGASGAGGGGTRGGGKGGAAGASASGGDSRGRGGTTDTASTACENVGCGGGTGCCPGYVCATFDTTSICRKACGDDSECEGGCCTPLSGIHSSACMPPSFCGKVYCAPEGETCFSAVACCASTICIQVSDAPVGSCVSRCTQDSDCSGGCCYELPSGNKACVPQSYCH